MSFVVYQVMGTLDGIHVRNHDMVTPLGKLFDASIDTLAHGFLVQQHLEVLRMWNSKLGFVYLVLVMVFYCKRLDELLYDSLIDILYSNEVRSFCWIWHH
jgi:phosphatidylglycerophosphate synthase